MRSLRHRPAIRSDRASRPAGAFADVLFRLFDAQRGNVALETALVAPILITLAVGASDIGLGMRVQAEVSDAAQAGVEYVELHGYTASAVQTAVTSATSLSVQASSTNFYACPTGTGFTPQSSGTTCGSYGSTAGSYASVTASASYTPLFPIIWGSNPVTFSSTATTRY
jgi:Flp pilus assembly protein TadG